MGWFMGGYLVSSLLGSSRPNRANTHAQHFMLKEILPHHACAQGSTSLASHPPTHHFQNCNHCSKLAPRPWPNISQSILHPHLGNQGQSPPSFCGTGTTHHISNQDKSLWAKKLPHVSGPAVWNSLPRWHYKSRTDTWPFQDWIENPFSEA